MKNTSLGVREERYEEDLHSFVGHDARQLGELHVVTDQHADPGTIVSKVRIARPPLNPQHFISSGVTCSFSYIS